ncbi:hypothetical protein PAECIP111893_03318 [Paenibacillus plantiphilus]|uniref:Uncharacterized protein n=1 Tax=Paenibacillus plantiphilus TaxID=2905650 RepID=A0ABN8GK60_9BACL|nr:hypothetical protein PAECIP111893_03318 [Paenibacillus plantiphilus]
MSAPMVYLLRKLRMLVQLNSCYFSREAEFDRGKIEGDS